MESTSSQPLLFLDILDNWADAQSQADGGACDQDRVFHRDPNTVILRVIVSAGAKFRTTCDLPAEQCDNINKLLKTTWETVQERVTTSLLCEYKWWEGVLLIGHSSLETKKNGRRTMLLAMHVDHQKTWMEWRVRNVEGGFAKIYNIGVAFGVPHCVSWKATAGYGRRPVLGPCIADTF